MKFYLIIISIFYISIVKSQVVNIEEKRTDDKSSGIQGNIDFDFNLTQNTIQILQVNNNAKLQFYKNKHLWLLFNSVSLSKANNQELINEGFQHLRYNYKINKSILAEAFIQYQYNPVNRLQKRYLAGFGPRFNVKSTDSLQLFFGPLSMYEYELIDNGIVNKTIRLSAYLSLAYKFNKSISINNITYYQPDYFNFNDYRVSSETNFKIKLTTKLSLDIRFSLVYDSKPPPEVNNIYYTLSNGIKYEF